MKSVFLRAYALGSLLGLAVLPQQAAHAQVTQTFRYTGGYQLFVVPEGVFTLTVKLWGAGGGWAGGSGAFVTGNLAVTPGATLTLLIGGGGARLDGSISFGGGGGGRASGSGGGRTAIRLSESNAVVSDELVTAAGGGGGWAPNVGVGGGGGLSAGQSGTGFGSGGGATQTSGGAGGGSGQAGSQFQGGSAGSAGGGGGGGGYFGGGGGVSGGGGGGGSSYYVNPAFAFNSALSQAGSQGSSGGVAPGGANDPNYLLGIGVGGGDFINGGNGLIVLSYLAVPEPGSLALLALGAGAFLIARRRRN